MQTQLLSLSEAAKKYNIPMGTLRDAIYRGDIKGFKIGSQWVVEVSSIEHFVAHRPKRGRPPKA